MSTKTKQNVADVAKMMDAQKGKHVGSIVMWTLLSPSVSTADLKALYAKHGLDWDAWGPEALDGEVTFHKAIAEAKRTVTGWRFVTLLDGKEKKVIGVVQESVDKAKEDVKYRTDWTTDAVKITYDKVNAAVKTTNPAHPVAKVVASTYKKLEDLYTTPDFTRFLVRNIKENGGAIQLRATGGTYFMPSSNYDLVLKHKAVVEECGVEFTVLNVKEDEISRQDLGRSAMRSMGEELKELELELQGWKDTPPRADTIGRRLEAYKALKGKAEMYASMLQIKADDLLTGLSACTKKAREVLGVVETAKAEKATKAPKEKATAQVQKVAQAQKVVVKTAQPSVKKPIKQAMAEAKAKVAVADKKEKVQAKKATSKVKVSRK